MVVVLKTKDILDEKDKRLRLISKEVKFPLTKKDKDLIDTMIKYLHDSQIDELAEKYDLRPGMGMSAIQLGVPKRYFVVVNEITEEDDEEQDGLQRYARPAQPDQRHGSHQGYSLKAPRRGQQARRRGHRGACA